MFPLDATATPNDPAQRPKLPGDHVASVVRLNPSASPSAASVGNWAITAGARPPTTNSPIITAKKAFLLELIHPPSSRAARNHLSGVPGAHPNFILDRWDPVQHAACQHLGAPAFPLIFNNFKCLRRFLPSSEASGVQNIGLRLCLPVFVKLRRECSETPLFLRPLRLGQDAMRNERRLSVMATADRTALSVLNPFLPAILGRVPKPRDSARSRNCNPFTW